MKLSHILLIVALSFATAFGTVFYFGAGLLNSNIPAVQETAYNRVLRTGVLRCGYADSPPYALVKDPSTGKISGILSEVTEAIAAKLNLKVEWTENTGWGTFIESLRSHRTDVFCAGLWRQGERGKYVGYGLPVYYVANYPYVAVDDHRFDQSLSSVNSPETRISAMDGEQSDIIAKTHFPKAKEVSVPQMGQLTDILVNVATHKADIVFAEPSYVNAYLQANPNTLRFAQDTPFQVFPSSLGVDIHEPELRDMLDSALVELHNQGVIEEIISKYTSDPRVFLRVAKPYLSGTR